MSEESKNSFLLSHWLFVRLLAIIFLIAFVSLWVQIIGLVGSNGILPAAEYLSFAEEEFPDDFYIKFPTLMWFNISDLTLHLLCGFGVLFSILFFIGIVNLFSIVALVVLYISLSTVSQVFLGFQWDNLLLETGFLTIFSLPFVFNLGFNKLFQSNKYVLFLFKLLLFKLVFFSGLVKILSGDYVWGNLTALTYHYETQPISNIIAYYVHHFPFWFHKISCITMFLVELVVPFSIFAFPLLRRIGCLSLILFQILILITGNYCFFNLLTIALSLLLLDDYFWCLIFPHLKSRMNALVRVKSFWNKKLILAFVSFVVVINSFLLFRILGLNDPIIKPLGNLYYSIYQFRIINSYGLFAVMTRTRPEVIVEGSNDGIHWDEYEFKFKAGDLSKPPPFVAPHQPRLDWQMWFAALGNIQRNLWFVNFCIKLLEDSQDVLKLVGKNPFPEKAPRYIRALLYNYKFSSLEERKNTGNWWKRELVGVYLPVISLEQFGK